MKPCYPQFMNAPCFPSSFETEERDSFNELKLQILEAFYRLDVALEDWIHDGGGKAGGASTGCRLKELTETSFADNIATKAQVSRFARLSDELDSAIRLRNLLVHCETSFGVLEGRRAIFLRPVSHDMRANGYVAVTDLDRVKVAINQVTTCARSLAAWRKQRDGKIAAAKETSAAELPN